MVGTFPLSRGYEGTMPRHAFDLLVLAVESFIQISNVNSVVAERKQLIMLVNMCCGVPPAECGMKHSVFDRVMRSTNVSLNADVSPPVEERRLRWTTAKFFVTGGEHVTSNDMFKAAEINRRKAEAAEREKEKKRRVEFHARRETALPIVDRLELELENDVGRLTSKELEVLLRWKGVAASKMGNVANRRLLYQQFAEGDIVEEVSIPAPWTDIDEAELVALRDAPIEMYDTAYGRFEEQKKRDVERSYQKMSAVEKEIFKKKMAEIDEADAGVDEE
jgi:hypothetical protein